MAPDVDGLVGEDEEAAGKKKKKMKGSRAGAGRAARGPDPWWRRCRAPLTS